MDSFCHCLNELNLSQTGRLGSNLIRRLLYRIQPLAFDARIRRAELLIDRADVAEHCSCPVFVCKVRPPEALWHEAGEENDPESLRVHIPAE